MSMNKYMHPRNIYKSPPDFKKLALDFPEFRPFVKQDVTGKVTVDFKDINSLRALSCTLLKKDFGLIVEIPPSKLIPTIPLRLNYILWIEDLLKVAGKSNDIIGIDIGTGASCIYPLLASKKNKWLMIATERDSESIAWARSNIERNLLQHLITVIEVTGEKLLEEESIINNKLFDFCMCNPPFFSNSQELHPFFKSRKINRPHPKNAFCASVNEVVSNGGEVEFITKLINESKKLGERIKIYSTMIGHKSSLPPLKKALREVEVVSFSETYFCQGNTTRWGLAWTFSKEFDLKKVPDLIKRQSKDPKTKHPLIYTLPLQQVTDCKLTFASDMILKLCAELEMIVEEVSRNKKILRYFITAHGNTWSNQRKKRRQKLTKCIEVDTAEEVKSEEMFKCSFDTSSNNLNNNSDESVKSPGKRTHEEMFDGSYMKKLKISTENGNASATFFKFTLAIGIEESNVYLELDNAQECDNREYLHQILQYIKNNLKTEFLH